MSEETSRPKNPNLRWYVVHTSTGFEMKAQKALLERIKAYHVEDKFGDVLVPQEKVVETVKGTGKKKTSHRKFLPGYILVQMEMSQQTWHLVMDTPKITGFVGAARVGGAPQNPLDIPAVTEEEVQRLTAQMTEAAEKPTVLKSFEKGENIRVVEGPFANFTGIVDEFRPDRGKVKVLVSIFGRATPVELDLMQVERA
ncbi:MAG: transcription termination/antitermination protein NusG [Deltaproteobacteria bacterium]|nr:transcription termination/antitermination protein NusG [Deltaproteobacteria bacterium]